MLHISLQFPRGCYRLVVELFIGILQGSYRFLIHTCVFLVCGLGLDLAPGTGMTVCAI